MKLGKSEENGELGKNKENGELGKAKKMERNSHGLHMAAVICSDVADRNSFGCSCPSLEYNSIPRTAPGDTARTTL